MEIPMSGHVRILVVGQNPSTKTQDNQSLHRLARWMDAAGIQHWSFVNVSAVPGRYMPRTEDRHFLWKILQMNGQPVVALGNNASEALKRFQTRHLKLPHPSGLNRQLNNPEVEALVIARLRELVEMHYV
jgi:hypothetical protein